MKNKNKIILLSAATAMAAAGLAVAGTFALFTSQVKDNVSVSAGVVSVNNALKITSGESLGTALTVTDTAATFTNGGTVALTGNTLAIAKMTPGDKITVNVAPENHSNVKIKYRTVVSARGLLFGGLKVTLGAKDVKSGTERGTWQELDAGAAFGANADLVVELPEAAGNEYQDLTATITINIEAIQANANVSDATHLAIDDAAKTGTILDEEGLEILGTNVGAGTYYEGYTFTLAKDLDLSYANWTPIPGTNATDSFRGTIDGASHKISGLMISEPNVNNVGLFGNLSKGGVKNLTFADPYIVGGASVGVVTGNVGTLGVTIDNVKITNATIIGNHYLGCLAGYSYGGTYTNNNIDGAVITCTPNAVGTSFDNGDKAGGLVGANNDYSSVTGNTVNNLAIKAYRDVGGLVGMQQTDQAVKQATYGVNTVTNSVIIADQSVNWYGDKAFNVKAFVGRDNTTGSILDVTACTGSGNTLKTIAHDGTVTVL